MNDDFFEKYQSYNTEPKESDKPAEPMTQLFGSQQTPSAQPTPAAQPTPTPFAPMYQATPVQPVQQSPVAPQPAVEKQAESPAFTNPYDTIYRANTEAPSERSTPYHAVDTAASSKPIENSDGYYSRSFTKHEDAGSDRHSKKSNKSGIGAGTIALILIVCILVSGAAGFGGSILANKLNLGGSNSSTADDDNGLVIHKVAPKEETGSAELVDKETSEITEQVADTVVEIVTEGMQTSSLFGQYITSGAGSGVIIDKNGTIITNNHVIEGARSITVTLRNGESYDAKMVGTDEELDIALIKIDADKDLPFAVFGDSDELKVGDKSVIIGNPLGTLGGSVTEGIISALDRSIVIDGKTMTLMQTDAAINAGNSGGGMFNGQGELIGIVVAKNYSGEVDNIGFVIPINNAQAILGDLQQYGYVRGKADTGMTFIDLSNALYTWYYYGTSEPGCYVSSVESGSNAERAGFKEGDRIISVDGQSISESADIKSIISGKSVGDEVDFEVARGNSTGTLTLKLEEKIPSSAR